MPYGWRVGAGSVLVEDEHQQRTVALARRLRAEGAALRAVGAGLDEAGFRPRTGKQWHVAALARIVGG